MMTDDQILKVVAAHKEGKKIQGKAPKLSNVWVDLVEPISWDFVDKVYRVAPEPRNNRWVCRIEDEAIVVNTGKEDIRFDRLPGRVVLFSKLVDEHNAAIGATSGEPEVISSTVKASPPCKPKELWLLKTTKGDWREYPCRQSVCDVQQIHVQVLE